MLGRRVIGGVLSAPHPTPASLTSTSSCHLGHYSHSPGLDKGNQETRCRFSPGSPRPRSGASWGPSALSLEKEG